MSTVAEKLGKPRQKQSLTPEEKKRRQRKGIIKGVVILAIAIFGSWAFYEGMKAASGTQFPVVVVVSESMEPNIHVGDLLFVHYVPPADIKNGTIADKTGDVILYNASGLWDPAITPPDPIVHRVVGKRFDVPTGKWYFVTKGDYNLDTDPPGSSGLEIEVPEDKVLGVVWGDIPYIGYVKIWLTSENIAIPLMIIIGALLVITIVWDTMHPEEEGEKKPKKGKQREVSLESPKEVMSQLGPDEAIPKTETSPGTEQEKPEPTKPPPEKTDINPPVKEKKDNLDFS